MTSTGTEFEEGQVADTPQMAEQLEAKGYTKCGNQLCDFWIDPEYAEQIGRAGGSWKCPRCGLSQNINTIVGGSFTPGGKTIAGFAPDVQGDIGEELVKDLGEIPGYGPIVWWHSGGSSGASPLDGATSEWGIEVKSVNADAANLRFISGRPLEREDKNNDVAKRGLKGVLGILVLLNYRTSLADLYLREMPLDPWKAGNGRMISGIAHFRHDFALQFMTEVPFKNPLVDPKNSTPQVTQPPVALGGDYRDDFPF